MTTPLEISVSEHKTVTVITLAGELDIATGDMVRSVVKELVGEGRTRVVIDASPLRFCDASGLEALLDSRAYILSVGGSLRLAGVHGVLALVLDVTGLRDLFVINKTPAESVTALSVTRQLSVV
ncbi:anti-sigma factor antagonist [Thermobispora bispora]|jgi:anti-sigma B factor antagonist|uniref:Anti-sigma factor antagonist n=1 Tax=Thermobispora bispora (strain ATCC 19993 / DSM 43833 / CBS 139.67 / JCM 10125 / KCTC 9307 / NBRC 14880 / R51) TaxID=469371 RepID=D6YAC8_THEBD|nr:STAS domain-containing protein [Thermobispora bispora]ADG90181.1 anti-sigma-factor antagonist [Thermobispora bispora DSM 43833]MBX6166573.1 STAS domain-containing protein [Thermobispora bispora]MDI9581981.1 STAS domain-containing protein [Thermobispora sp.]